MFPAPTLFWAKLSGCADLSLLKLGGRAVGFDVGD
jgi:hypothetical protein